MTGFLASRSEASSAKPANRPKPDPKAGEWDFDGSCAPHCAGAGWGSHYLTFTLGIFQWVPKANGEGLKRGKVIRRVKGYTASPDEAFEKARQIVAELNGTC